MSLVRQFQSSTTALQRLSEKTEAHYPSILKNMRPSTLCPYFKNTKSYAEKNTYVQLVYIADKLHCYTYPLINMQLKQTQYKYEKKDLAQLDPDNSVNWLQGPYSKANIKLQLFLLIDKKKQKNMIYWRTEINRLIDIKLPVFLRRGKNDTA